MSASAITTSVSCSRRSASSERHQGLAGARAAHHDAPLGELVEIEGVQRVPEFPHHEIGDVGDVVERPQPDRFDEVDEPGGRRGDGDAAHQARGVSRASLEIVDGDGGERIDGGWCRRPWPWSRPAP